METSVRPVGFWAGDRRRVAVGVGGAAEVLPGHVEVMCRLRETAHLDATTVDSRQDRQELE
jgi:hypothetical protein